MSSKPPAKDKPSSQNILEQLKEADAKRLAKDTLFPNAKIIPTLLKPQGKTQLKDSLDVSANCARDISTSLSARGTGMLSSSAAISLDALVGGSTGVGGEPNCNLKLYNNLFIPK